MAPAGAAAPASLGIGAAHGFVPLSFEKDAVELKHVVTVIDDKDRTHAARSLLGQ